MSFQILKNYILNKDNEVLGFNIGMNAGRIAGQTIMHCHIHLIPRRKGDVKKPQGGVRGVIPNKQHYIRKQWVVIKDKLTNTFGWSL